MITFRSTSDNKFGILTTIDSLHDANFAVTVGARGYWHHDNYQISFQSCWCQLNVVYNCCSHAYIFSFHVNGSCYSKGSLGVCGGRVLNSWLVHVLACRVSGDKPVPEPMMGRQDMFWTNGDQGPVSKCVHLSTKLKFVTISKPCVIHA